MTFNHYYYTFPTVCYCRICIIGFHCSVLNSCRKGHFCLGNVIVVLIIVFAFPFWPFSVIPNCDLSLLGGMAINQFSPT